MPRTMLNDQHWSKLETILRNFDIYLKRNLRHFIEAILYRIRTGCPWRDLPPDFGNQIRYSKNIVDGLNIIN